MMIQNQKINILPIYTIDDISFGEQLILQPFKVFAWYKEEKYIFSFKLISQNGIQKLFLQTIQKKDSLLHIKNFYCELNDNQTIDVSITNIINKYFLDMKQS